LAESRVPWGCAGRRPHLERAVRSPTRPSKRCTARSSAHQRVAHLAEAARLHGSERLAATLDALTVLESGEHLPAARSGWADDTRREIAERAADARHDAATVALSLGRFDDAHRLCDAVLRTHPLREGSWRLSMRIASALGNDDAMLAAYRNCELALATLGMNCPGTFL
jgi:two-component SAPR family response regulator